MPIKFAAIIIIGVFISGSFFNLSHAQDLTPWARDPRPYRERQREKRADFKQYMREKNVSILDQKLKNNNSMTKDEKKDLIRTFENQYSTVVPTSIDRHNQDLAAFDRIANDPKLTVEQKKAALEAYIGKKTKKE